MQDSGKTPFSSRAISRLTKQREDWWRKSRSHVLPIVDSGLGLRDFIYVKTNICGSGIHILQSINSLIKCRCQRIKVNTGSRSLYSVIFLFKFYRIKLYFYFSISKQMPNKRIQQLCYWIVLLVWFNREIISLNILEW